MHRQSKFLSYLMDTAVLTTRHHSMPIIGEASLAVPIAKLDLDNIDG
jgi:hypothetical protein